MRNQMNRQALTMAALLLAGIMSGGAASAMDCGVPEPSGRNLADVAVTLHEDKLGSAGDNMIWIPSFSPINTSSDPDEYGFKGICEAFDLTGTASQIRQIDPATGRISSHFCDRDFVADPYMPCQAVIINMAPGLASRTKRVPAGDTPAGSWSYTVNGNGEKRQDVEDGDARGDNLFGIPVGIASLDPEDLCSDLNLPKHTRLLQLDAASGLVDEHRCEEGVAGFSLREGGAILIQAPGSRGEAVSVGHVALAE